MSIEQSSSEDYRQLALDSFFSAVESSYNDDSPRLQKITKIKASLPLPSIKDPKKTDEEFISFFQNKVRPQILECIITDESLESASTRLTNIHSDYLNDRDLDSIEKTFTFSSTEFTSKQEFLTKANNTTELKIAKSCCYVRDRYGLPGLRKHTLTKKESGEVLLELYHHGSPVPIKIKDFKKRIDITKLNFDQLHLNVGVNEPITEIRLLSPLKIPYRWLEHFISNQKQYDQILETYLAMLLNNKDTRMFVYGVNKGRGYFDNLQNYINTRSLNDLITDYFQKHNPGIYSNLATKKGQLDRKRQALLTEINSKMALGLPESKFKSEFKKLLEQHHKDELAYANFIMDNYTNVLLKAPDLSIALNLVRNNRWAEKEHNYQLQTTLARIESNLGRKVATGCNDGKDRSGRMGITAETNEIFKIETNNYPNLLNKNDQIRVNVIQTKVYEESSPRFAAEAISIPGANHLEIHGRDGNEHLNANKKVAHLFKNMHRLPKKYKIQDSLQAAAENQKSTKGNWLVATIVGFIFVTFAALFGSPELASANTAYDAHTKTMSSGKTDPLAPLNSSGSSRSSGDTLPSGNNLNRSRNNNSSNDDTDSVGLIDEENSLPSSSKIPAPRPASGSDSSPDGVLPSTNNNLRPDETNSGNSNGTDPLSPRDENDQFDKSSGRLSRSSNDRSSSDSLTTQDLTAEGSYDPFSFANHPLAPTIFCRHSAPEHQPQKSIFDNGISCAA